MKNTQELLALRQLTYTGIWKESKEKIYIKQFNLMRNKLTVLATCCIYKQHSLNLEIMKFTSFNFATWRKKNETIQPVNALLSLY